MKTAQEQQLLIRFGKKVAEYRKNIGMSQQQLAEAMGMNVVSIAYIETGKRWVRPGTLMKLATNLKVNVSDLF